MSEGITANWRWLRGTFEVCQRPNCGRRMTERRTAAVLLEDVPFDAAQCKREEGTTKGKEDTAMKWGSWKPPKTGKDGKPDREVASTTTTSHRNRLECS